MSRRSWHIGCNLENSRRPRQKAATQMLWTIVVLLIALWVLGLMLKIASGLIHLLLVIAFVIIVFRLLSGRRVA
jgi:Family of unknown function (DUF5670)